MTHQLIKYDAACIALAECKSIDEVKSWADKAAAMQAYSRMAKDKRLEIDAAEIRLRAERRLGEMLTEQKAEGGLHQGGRPTEISREARGVSETGREQRPVSDKPKLADAGISKDLSSRAQKLAAVPPEEFESEVGEWRERVSQEGARVTARLEAAGERAQAKKAKTAAKKTTAQDEADRIAEEAHGDFDPLAELEAAQKEVQELRAQLDAAEADDLKAEALKWKRMHHTAVRRQDELMNVANGAQKHAAFLKRQLDRCGKAVGEKDPDKIAPTVEAFVRQHAPRAA